MFCTYSTVCLCKIGIKPENSVIEIFNLRLHSRHEMQTKHPFGENGMDYTILLLVYRDPGNCSAALCPLIGGA